MTLPNPTVVVDHQNGTSLKYWMTLYMVAQQKIRLLILIIVYNCQINIKITILNYNLSTIELLITSCIWFLVEKCFEMMVPFDDQYSYQIGEIEDPCYGQIAKRAMLGKI